MRIHLGTNYLGYGLARHLEAGLLADGHEVRWHGSPAFDDGDDYPHYAIGVARSVVQDEDVGVPALGISCGATGCGEVITANKVNGARAITATDAEVVIDGRKHADANVLALGSQVLTPATARTLVDAFLDTPFSGLLDDARRIVNTAEFETSNTVEGWTLTH